MQKQLWSSCGLTQHRPFSVQLQFLPQVGLTNLRMESNLFLKEKVPSLVGIRLEPFRLFA